MSLAVKAALDVQLRSEAHALSLDVPEAASADSRAVLDLLDAMSCVKRCAEIIMLGGGSSSLARWCFVRVTR